MFIEPSQEGIFFEKSTTTIIDTVSRLLAQFVLVVLSVTFSLLLSILSDK